MTAAKKPFEPIADVAHPGKSAPSSTSKPVLITNRPILKDPMVVVDKTSDDPAAPEVVGGQKITVKSASPPRLQPPSPSPAPTADEPATKQPSTDDQPEAPDETPPSSDGHQPNNQAAEADKPADTAAEDTAATKPATPSKQQLEAEAAEQTKRDADLQKLVDTKQYFLPINSVEKRRTKRFIILGVIVCLLLAVAWVDIALDAGLIHLGGIKPVTHFFSN